MSSIQPVIRQLLRVPGFAVLAVGFLGVSLAALLALVTAAHALLLKPLPFPGGERLVEARGYSSKMGFGLGYSAPRALGSSEQRLSRDVVLAALRSIMPGLVLGVAGALTVGHLLSAKLFQVQPFDPFTFAVVVLAFLGSALLAGWLPARSAAKVSPALVLRQD